jgi:hypothetical protein
MVYPPVYYWIVSPLSRLPYREAAWAWTAISLASFLLAVSLFARTFGEAGTLARAIPVTDPRWAAIRGPLTTIALPAAVMFFPFVENLVSSQKATFLLLALSAALVLLRGGHAFVAGMALGTLAVKPQMAIVIPAALLAKGQWRVASGAVLAVAALLTASMAIGHDLVSAWVRFLASAGDYIRFAGGYRERLHGLYAFWTLLAGEPTTLVRVATIGSAVVVAMLVARLLRGAIDVRTPRFLAQFSGLVIATVLLCTHILTYDLTILLIPIAVLAWLALRGGMPPAARRRVLWLVGTRYAGVGFSSFAVRSWGVQPTTPILLALLAVLAALPERWDEAA